MTTNRSPLRLTIGQLDPVVGDIDGNSARVLSGRNAAQSAGADMVVLPELFISGYPPEDLVLRPAFIAACRSAVERLAEATAGGGPAILVGAPWDIDGALFNAALLLEGGVVAAVRAKLELPNYGVFDEKRVFVAGTDASPIEFKGRRIGLPICEDLWSPEVCRRFRSEGAEMLLSIHGSPYWRGKLDQRHAVARAAAAAAKCPVVYLNMVGGQDELAFDGGSFGVRSDGEIAFQLSQFNEEVESISLASNAAGELDFAATGPVAMSPTTDEADWRACVIGLSDYVAKNGFASVVLGLSGGIDSAVVAAMAVDALGADKVRCVMLPYRFTSEASLTDAAATANALGVRYDTLPIEQPIEGAESALAPLFAGRDRDVTEENIQSRMRGLLLMAISNKFGELLVTTGNKSEVSVGYATLYGDMNGGFNPIKDLFKTDVYRLAEWRNRNRPDGLLGPAGEVIPAPILTKPPTAELRADQTDQDSLPPYDELDRILVALIEDELSIHEIVASGHDARTVQRVARLVALAEHKRRQAAPGVKVTKRNFGRGRRYPITNRFVENGAQLGRKDGD